MTDEDGRYRQHNRRTEDRLPPDYKPRYSQADAEQLFAEAIRRALETRDSDPTGVHDVPSKADIKAVRGRDHVVASWIKAAAIVVPFVLTVILGTIASIGWLHDQIKADLSPVHARITMNEKTIREIKTDLRKILEELRKNR